MTIIKGTLEEIQAGARDYWTIQAMLRFGGSFVKCLGRLAERADTANLAKIKSTWPAYWTQYEKMGVSIEKKP